ncbi:MAG: efflux RND transporter periplasmic adaptor subunit [Magnetococcales bacterium]|nr:efflux RND transporter periplasmic adaptor subunit [Magnetococcales bacterium]
MQWILVLAACSESQQDRASATVGKSSAAGSAAIAVEVAPVVHRTVSDRLRAVGHLEACRTVAVQSRVDGAIVATHVHDGASVTAGQLLFELDARMVHWQLQQRRAERNRDQAQLALARLHERRQQQLKQHEATPGEALDQARTNRESAEALLMISESAVHQAELLLDFTRIQAPVAGRIGSVLLHTGNLVKAYDDKPLLVIHQIDPICVRYALQERDWARMARQTTATTTIQVGVPDHGELTITGHLDSVDPVIDQATGTFLAKGVIPNNAQMLRPGLYVEVETILSQRPNVAVVPAQALLTRTDGRRALYLRQGDNRVALRLLQPSEILREEAQEALLAGTVLSAGDQVVVTGQWRLSDGATIAVSEHIKQDHNANQRNQ